MMGSLETNGANLRMTHGMNLKKIGSIMVEGVGLDPLRAAKLHRSEGSYRTRTEPPKPFRSEP